MSSAYGGGTANMEYMSLTGMNLSLFTSTISTPYSQVVSKQKLPHSINQNFKESIAIHPFLGIYYSRQSVYKKFAFDAFHFVGSKNDIKFKKKIKNSHQLSDETAYDNTLAALKESKTDNMFINLVTMQNHMPYNNWYGNESSNYASSGAAVDTPDRISQSNTYASGLEYTDDDHYNLTLEDLSKNQQELFKDYQLVQYDLTAGKGYLKSLDFMNQYLNNKDN